MDYMNLWPNHILHQLRLRMIERLEKISTELFKNALRTYTRNDLLIHKKAHAKNLTETLLLFPNQGVNFHIFKKSWNPSLYYQVTRANPKSNRHAAFYGIKNWKRIDGTIGKDLHPKRLSGLSKRGIWSYSLGSFHSCTTDNGVHYSRRDLEAYIKVSGLGQSKLQPEGQTEQEQE